MLRIKIETDNAAFEGSDYGPEVARILRDAAERIENARPQHHAAWRFPLYDINGNRVGDAENY